jgi:hypothetical protein
MANLLIIAAMLVIVILAYAGAIIFTVVLDSLNG